MFEYRDGMLVAYAAAYKDLKANPKSGTGPQMCVKYGIPKQCFGAMLGAAVFLNPGSDVSIRNGIFTGHVALRDVPDIVGIIAFFHMAEYRRGEKREARLRIRALGLALLDHDRDQLDLMLRAI